MKAKSKVINGFKITMCLTEDEGLSVEDGGKYVLMCEEHGSIVQDTNKKRLWEQVTEVSDWCEIHNETKVGA